MKLETEHPSLTTCAVITRAEGGGGQTSGSDEISPAVLCITKVPTVLKYNRIIEYGVPKKGVVTLVFYDILGTKVQLLKREYLNPGYYQAQISTENLASGIYFVVLTQNNNKVSKKMLFVK